MTWETWTDDEYHAQKGYISRGRIVHACKSLALFDAYERGIISDGEESDAMALGSLAHMATLQTDRFASEVLIKPPMDKRRTKNLDESGCYVDGDTRILGKVAGESWEAENAGRTIVTAREHALALGIATAVFRHPTACALVCRQTEKALTWSDDETGLECKALYDAVFGPVNCADLKTTGDPSPSGFARQCAQHMLHLQDAWYTLGLAAENGCPWHDVPPMVFVVVRSTPPHEVALYTLGFEERTAGMAIVRGALDTIAKRRESKDWRNPWEVTDDGQPVLLSLPSYCLRNPFEVSND